MTPFGLVVAALAAWQAVEVWQHGSIFAGWRARVQAWPGEGVRGWLGELLLCPFCQSVWVGTAAAVAVVADHWAVMPLVYGLAASRLANLANDVTRGVSRTPNQKQVAGGLPDGGPPAANIEIKIHEAPRDDDDTGEHDPLDGGDGGRS